MTQNVSLIPPGAYDIVAEDATRHLEAAVEDARGRKTLRSLWTKLYTEDYQLWMFFDAENSPEGSLVTKFERYPTTVKLRLVYIGGANLDGWHEELLEVLEQFARMHGCSGLETVGRFGWKRFLKKFGWEATHIVCEKTFAAVEESRDAA